MNTEPYTQVTANIQSGTGMASDMVEFITDSGKHIIINISFITPSPSSAYIYTIINWEEELYTHLNFTPWHLVTQLL